MVDQPEGGRGWNPFKFLQREKPKTPEEVQTVLRKIVVDSKIGEVSNRDTSGSETRRVGIVRKGDIEGRLNIVSRPRLVPKTNSYDETSGSVELSFKDKDGNPVQLHYSRMKVGVPKRILGHEVGMRDEMAEELRISRKPVGDERTYKRHDGTTGTREQINIGGEEALNAWKEWLPSLNEFIDHSKANPQPTPQPVQR